MAITDYFIPLLWTTIFLTIWSVLYRENRAYRVVEALTIGLNIGLIGYASIDNVYNRVIRAYNDYSTGVITQGVLIGVYIAATLGFLTWTRLHERTMWISRLPIAIFAGIGMGITVRGVVEAQITTQIMLSNWYVPGDLTAILNTIIVAVGTFTTISYFLFTHKQEGPLYISALIGRIIILIAFGTLLGLFLMTNVANAVGMTFEMVRGPSIIIVIIALLLIGYDIFIGKWPWDKKTEDVPK